MDHGLGRAVDYKSRLPKVVTLTRGQALKKSPMKCNRLLITVTVMGSAGPLRFLVNADESVMSVIELTLKGYAQEGRLPALGSDFNNFLLYRANGASDALLPTESIGSYSGRNFILHKKQGINHPGSGSGVAKGAGKWKSWLNKSIACRMLLSHRYASWVQLHRHAGFRSISSEVGLLN